MARSLRYTGHTHQPRGGRINLNKRGENGKTDMVMIAIVSEIKIGTLAS